VTPTAAALNVLLRSSIAYFLAEVLLNRNDPRFRGKAIPVRNLVIVGGLSLFFPALHILRRRWRGYPFWTDNLWLSLFWLDMAGNSFDLYDRYVHFDLIPHFHGTGASAVALQRGFGLTRRRAFVIATALHTGLEAQEYATDLFFGTHNVRGWWDSAGDLAAGLLGAAAYLWPLGLRPRISGGAVGGGFVLFHRLEDPASAAVRRSIVARGLKARIDFQNVDSEDGRALFAERGGGDLPAIWDGAQIRVGRAAIEAWLAELTGDADGT
jgi:hypothetical protein